MKALVLFSLLILLTLPGCDAFDSITGPDGQRATLSGRVTMASTGGGHYPAAVALVQGREEFPYDSVDPDGRYEIRNVKPGQYIVVVTLGQGAGTREGHREPIEIVAGSNVKDFVLR
jgi:hypothetical protein